MAKQMWELKQSTQADTLDLFIYGDIEDITIDWTTWSIVESENSAKFFKEALAAHPDVKQILTSGCAANASLKNFAEFSDSTIDQVVQSMVMSSISPVSYTHLRAHETRHDLVC